MTKLAAWLRKNSERYLMQSAQVRVAKKYSLIALPGSHRQRWPQQMLPEGPAI